MTNAESRRILHLGKSVERVDMYLRLGYPTEEISAELNNLLKHISRYASDGTTIINTEAYDYLKSAVRNNISLGKHKNDIIKNIENLVEVNVFETASV